MNKNQIITLVVVGLVAGFIGYKLGNSSGGTVQGVSSNEAYLQAKLEEVKKMFPVAPDTNMVTGKVESVKGNIITLNTSTNNPFDESPKIRQVKIDASTVVIKTELKSLAVMKKEKQSYVQKISTPNSSSTEAKTTLPSPFIETEISASNIKVGDTLTVEAANKIHYLESFDATKVILRVVSNTN